MRVQICQEGEESYKINGQVIDIGAIKWEDTPYAITWEAMWDAEHLLGKATDIQRDENGLLTAEIDMESLTDNGRRVWADVGTTIYANKLVTQRIDGIMHVTSCQLRALYFTLGVPWRNPTLEG